MKRTILITAILALAFALGAGCERGRPTYYGGGPHHPGGSYGGAYVGSVTQDLILSGSPFEGNRAQVDGGGLYVSSVGGNAALTNSPFEDNHAVSGNWGGLWLQAKLMQF